MFLTKIDLDPERRLARKYLGSPQAMHAVVMKAASATSPVSDGGTGRVLWRVDQGAFGTSLFIASPAEPDTAQLVADAAPLGAQARVGDYEPFLNRLAAGQVWAFRLAANPSRSAPRGPGVRGKVYGHVTVEQQRQWFLTRASGHGFEPFAGSDNPGEESVVVVRRERPVFGRNDPHSQRRAQVTINRTVFEGLLRVTDAEALRTTLVSGLGRSKAYGCGLMTLARPQTA
ncbi:type I-E CRISPR-associated protein Cas6/Cse3/CasE [Actinomyces slackii]|uniref:CRISPR-associated protein Cas6/Cse3/CasE, subtype I-E/ECOLI n=1 Tax=Actinomyces slackii TaxID=52774 RepID=A0A3S4STK9_9ACTO|nr:type I-E CRISPR-associated protein Cas6/Cse3/CasE [Actinomyces slackii]VEG74731.1 CRISPR-associated protein Cas6/Cse3/CasE, subtype I-E/ECOLI [Actinomyces slackii]